MIRALIPNPDTRDGGRSIAAAFIHFFLRILEAWAACETSRRCWARERVHSSTHPWPDAASSTGRPGRKAGPHVRMPMTLGARPADRGIFNAHDAHDDAFSTRTRK